MTSTIKELVTNEVKTDVNVESCFYNCGGFALGTFRWEEVDDGYFNCGVPYGTMQRFARELDLDIFSNEEKEDYFGSINQKCEDCVEDMIYRYDFVREIDSIEQLKDDEYLVAFRCSVDDFHFIRRMSNGTWLEKKGGYPISQIREEDVFAPYWISGYDWDPTVYCGDIRLLAVKKVCIWMLSERWNNYEGLGHKRNVSPYSRKRSREYGLL